MTGVILRRNLFVVSCALLAAGCSGSTTAASSDRPGTPYYPGGLGPYSSMKGVYADRWTAPRTSFLVAIPPNARRMRVAIDVPVGKYRVGEEGLVVRLGDDVPVKRLQLPLGPQVVIVPISPHSRGKTVKVSIAAQATFVPPKLGINSDGRQLGVLFNDVSFE